MATAAKRQVRLPGPPSRPPPPHPARPSPRQPKHVTPTHGHVHHHSPAELILKASTNVRLADTDMLQSAPREPKTAPQRPFHSFHSHISKTNWTLNRDEYDRLGNTDKDPNGSGFQLKPPFQQRPNPTAREILLALKGQILLQ